ncbi:hypothetical protein BRADI_4g32813v3 [Brachypodium distachyon]|uniref:Uncharacterized protein n=1 Tax=Brachypodium distachyon TaxID=15368 RepID=A0A0Q3EW83_BRADI|nr:hypothetical protein BRADI_4g32813v3 [Brachypodium distachyon]
MWGEEAGGSPEKMAVHALAVGCVVDISIQMNMGIVVPHRRQVAPRNRSLDAAGERRAVVVGDVYQARWQKINLTMVSLAAALAGGVQGSAPGASMGVGGVVQAGAAGSDGGAVGAAGEVSLGDGGFSGRGRGYSGYGGCYGGGYNGGYDGGFSGGWGFQQSGTAVSGGVQGGVSQTGNMLPVGARPGGCGSGAARAADCAL